MGPDSVAAVTKSACCLHGHPVMTELTTRLSGSDPIKVVDVVTKLHLMELRSNVQALTQSLAP